MPIYEFQCEDCGQAFEELVFGSAVEKVSCPECASGEVSKLISTFASRVPNGSSASFSSNPAPSCNTGSL